MHLISCRQTMSGEHSLSQVRRWSIRCRTELTFHVAIRMQGGPRAGAYPGNPGFSCSDEELVTTHFPAVAYHVQEGCDNRLQIRRKNRRQGAREEPSSPFRAGGREKL